MTGNRIPEAAGYDRSGYGANYGGRRGRKDG